MSNDLYDYLERIASSLEGILVELKAINGHSDGDKKTTKLEVPEKKVISNDDKTERTRIQQYFEDKGFEVFHTHDLDSANPMFITIANNIGSSYSAVEPLIKEIKRNLAKGQQFTLCIKEYSPKDITYMCGLATTLKQHGLLKEYIYKKSPHFIILAKPENSSKIHDFYTGHWLEYYTASVVRSAMSGRRGARSVNINTEVRDKLDSILEFDVIATFRDDVFWIECKTGEYKKYIDKYEKTAIKLGLDSSHVFLVIAGIDDATVKALNEQHSITICNVESFKTVFESSLNRIIVNE